MRKRTKHELSWLTAISDAGSTPAASTNLRQWRRLSRRSFSVGGLFPNPAIPIGPTSQRKLPRRSLSEGGKLQKRAPPVKFVCILQSLVGEHFYTGITDDLDARLSKHNSGAVTHTSKFRPWRHQELRRVCRPGARYRIRKVSEVRIRTSFA
jgi:hypothetical protein